MLVVEFRAQKWGIVQFIFVFAFIFVADARKLRTWLGPNNMISGTAPYPRAYITYAVTSVDSKLYIYAGFTDEGIKHHVFNHDFCVSNH